MLTPSTYVKRLCTQEYVGLNGNFNSAHKPVKTSHAAHAVHAMCKAQRPLHWKLHAHAQPANGVTIRHKGQLVGSADLLAQQR